MANAYTEARRNEGGTPPVGKTGEAPDVSHDARDKDKLPPKADEVKFLPVGGAL